MIATRFKRCILLAIVICLIFYNLIGTSIVSLSDYEDEKETASQLSDNIEFKDSHLIRISEQTFSDTFLAIKNSDKFQNLLSVLYELNAFVVNIDILKSIQNIKKSEKVNITKLNPTENYLEFGIYSPMLNQTDILESFNKLAQYCSVYLGNNDSLFKGRTIVTNIYLRCDKIRAKIALFAKRTHFCGLETIMYRVKSGLAMYKGL